MRTKVIHKQLLVPAREEQLVSDLGALALHCLPWRPVQLIDGPGQKGGRQLYVDDKLGEDGPGGRLEERAFQDAFSWDASERPLQGVGKAVASFPLAPEAEQSYIWLKAGLSYVAMALPLFPRHPRRLARKPPEGKRTAHGNEHVWGKEAAGWVRCTKCWVPVMPGSERSAPHAKESRSWS